MSTGLTKTKRFLKAVTTQRLGLKLTAFVITILLLTLVRFREKSERFFEVEVVPLLPEPVTGLVMTSAFPRTVRVRLSGSSSIINALTPREIPAIEVDLTTQKLGTSIYYFNEDVLAESLRNRSKKMQFVSVVRIIPESVQIKMERLVSRQLPVTVSITGKLPAGLELATPPKVIPSEVMVVGPTSQMRELKSIETDEVFLDGLDVGEHVQIVAATPQLGVSIKRAEDLAVTLMVRYIMGERLISGLPVSIQGTTLLAEARPETVSIKLTGPLVILEGLNPHQLKPTVFVDKEQAEPRSVLHGDVTLPWLPDEVKITEVDPPSVNVWLSAVSLDRTKARPGGMRKESQ